jgi:hypothetical protein
MLFPPRASGRTQLEGCEGSSQIVEGNGAPRRIRTSDLLIRSSTRNEESTTWRSLSDFISLYISLCNQ